SAKTQRRRNNQGEREDPPATRQIGTMSLWINILAAFHSGIVTTVDLCKIDLDLEFLDTVLYLKSVFPKHNDIRRIFCEAARRSSDGSATSVPKGANTLEGKLPAEKTMLWHMRFGHIGEKGLRTLKNKNLVEGLNDCNLEFNFL
ncbi:GAG-pre-integrase domain-containing protein, partial [Enterobacter hormaechei]|uniref:GAG-pre-integrase domain-containing protein n=1 Tax=Enterobacter hormaechei TaxID=158836 RepID=UPI0023E3E1AF